MPPVMSRLRRLAGPALALSLFAQPAVAQQVTLSSDGGAVDLTGRLLSFDNGIYTVETSLGVISVPDDAATCRGAACPAAGPPLTIAAGPGAGMDMAEALLAAWAAAEGAQTAPLEPRTAAAAAVTPPRGLKIALPGGPVLAARVGGADGAADVTLAAAPPLGPAAGAPAGTQIALDGAAFVLHPAMPFDTLTPAELRDLLSGATVHWDALGGPDLPVTVIAPPAGGRALAAARALMLAPAGASLAPGARRAGDVAAAVARTPGAIGITPLGATAPARAVRLGGACGLTTVAGAFDALAGEYPVRAGIHLRTRAGAPAPAARFAAFAGSPGAHPALAGAELVPRDILRRDQSLAAHRVRAAIDLSPEGPELHLLREIYIDMLEWDRLSATFRFAARGREAPAAAGAELDRLAGHVAALPAGAQIMMAGFASSGEGDFAARRALSRQRAETLAEALLARTGPLSAIRVDAKGFADLKPVGCYADPGGRALNRRVEVWIRK